MFAHTAHLGGSGVRVLFFWVFGGDLGGGPIWSGRSAVFGFVRICSGLFGALGGDPAWMAAPGVRGWLARGGTGISRTVVLLRVGYHDCGELGRGSDVIVLGWRCACSGLPPAT